MSNGRQRVPPEVAPVLKAIGNQFSQLSRAWGIYKGVFRTSEKDVDLMNELAPAFLGQCQGAMGRDIIIRICRLCDPAQTSRQMNLSLEQLVNKSSCHFCSHQNTALKTELHQLKQQYKPLKLVRDKRLAHLDLRKAVAPGGQVYEGVTDERIDELVRAIRRILRMVYQYFGPDRDWPAPSAASYHGETFLAVLREARAHRSKA